MLSRQVLLSIASLHYIQPYFLDKILDLWLGSVVPVSKVDLWISGIGIFNPGIGEKLPEMIEI